MLETASVDLVCSDLLCFWNVTSESVWDECFRAMKPGAFGFVTSVPSQVLLYKNVGMLERAGFEVVFTSVYWAFGDKISRDSWGQPRASASVVIVFMKPLSESGYFKQALANRKGVTWLDRGRIPTEECGGSKKKMSYFSGEGDMVDRELPHPGGRFSPNLLVNNSVLDIGIRTISSGGKNIRRDMVYDGGWKDRPETMRGLGGYGDQGDFSRYFDLDRWYSSVEPEKGRYAPNLLVSGDVLNDGKNHHAGQGQVGSGSGHENEYFGTDSVVRSRYDDKGSFSRYFDLDAWFRSRAGVSAVRHSSFPLFCYLLSIGSEPGDIVVNPVVTSGVIAVASYITGRKFTGICPNENVANSIRSQVDSLALACDEEK